MNVPNLFMIEDRPGGPRWIPATPFEQNDALLTIKGLNGKVARTYTLGIGTNPNQHITTWRQYDESAFVAVDNALAAARNHGVRLIIPLINDNNPTAATSYFMYGDYGRFVNLRNIAFSTSLPYNAFFTDAGVISDFKHLISFMLNRVNTVNGILYKNDEFLMALQLGNNLGSRSNTVAPSSWSVDIAQYIKSIAPNMLVMDSTIGGASRIPAATLSSPYIDIFMNTYYGGTASPATDANAVANNNKVFIAAEFGFQNDAWYESFMSATVNNAAVAGSLIWSLR